MSKPNLIIRIEQGGALTLSMLVAYRVIWGTALDALLMIGFTFMALFYLWSGFFLFNHMLPQELLLQAKKRSLSSFSITGGIWMGVIYSFATISLLFGINFYPGMHILMWLALFLLAFSSVLFFYMSRTNGKMKKPFRPAAGIRAALTGGLLLLLLLSPLENRLQWFYGDHPEFIQAYLEHRENPDCTQALEKLKTQRSLLR